MFFYPPALADLSDASAKAFVAHALDEVLNIAMANNTGLSSNCSKCIAALSIGQMVSKMAPTYMPAAMELLCKLTGFKTDADCEETYSAGVLGAPWTQVLANAHIAGLDGRYICAYLSKDFCPRPPVIPRKAKFPKPRPLNPKQPKPNGKRAKVFHLSDLHLGKSLPLPVERVSNLDTNCSVFSRY